MVLTIVFGPSRSNYNLNKNECSVAATGPPICEGLRENPKFLSSSKAEKFELLLLHIVLLGDVGYRMCEGCLGGLEGMSETGRTMGFRSSQKPQVSIKFQS